MQIENISFEITALLGKTVIPITTYFGLQVGDILVLDQPVEETILVRIGTQECGRATPGLFETHKAITIDERIHPR